MAAAPLELASPLADLPDEPTHYERLGLSPSATSDEIRAAQVAWQAALDTDGSEAAADAVGALDRDAERLAFAVLGDGLRRRTYDAYLESRRRMLSRGGRWWRQPALRRRLVIALVLGAMLAAVTAVGLAVWQSVRA